MQFAIVKYFFLIFNEVYYICPMETKKAGRKPLPAGEKKIAITIFPKAKDIEKVGGIEQAKEIALKAIETHEIQDTGRA